MCTLYRARVHIILASLYMYMYIVNMLACKTAMNIINLMGRGSKLHRLSSLSDLRESSNTVFKDVEQCKITVIVEVYVHYMLGV